MSMSLDEADIWQLRQMAESPYYATRRQFLLGIADKLEAMGERLTRFDSLWAEYQERRHNSPNPALLSVAAKRLESDLQKALDIIQGRKACRHGIAFDTLCAKCEDAMHAEPADQKLRRG